MNQQWYAPPAAPLEPSTTDDLDFDHLEPVGFWIRFGARAVDALVGAGVGFVGGFVGSLLAVVLRQAGVIAGPARPHGAGALLVSFVAGAVGTLAYHVACERIGGATVGKAAFGLRVCATNGRPCTFRGAVIRSLAYYIDSFFFGVVAYSVMSKSVLQQRLGDQWGKTAVFKAASLPAGARPGSAVGVGIVIGLLLWALQAGLTAVVNTV